MDMLIEEYMVDILLHCNDQLQFKAPAPSSLNNVVQGSVTWSNMLLQARGTVDHLQTPINPCAGGGRTGLDLRRWENHRNVQMKMC